MLMNKLISVIIFLAIFHTCLAQDQSIERINGPVTYMNTFNKPFDNELPDDGDLIRVCQ